MVKRKTGILQNFTGRRGIPRAGTLPVLAILTFISSWTAVYPARTVERWYSRGLFPWISSIAEPLADAVPFSWLDVVVPLALLLTVVIIIRRKPVWLLNLIAVLYLIFFWSWGLNYHREPLASKLPMDSSRAKADAIDQFARRAAVRINMLYLQKQRLPYDEGRTRGEAAQRVGRVVSAIDRRDWNAPQRLKVSGLASLWFHMAGIDGMFNPFPQEPIVSNSLLDIERPFVMTHELAHVRGYPDEGEANLIAVLATILSSDRDFQYSGWLSIWLYLRTRELDQLLDAGPRADLQRIFDRFQKEQIPWVSSFQTVLLDLFLKANSVEQGVRSYSKVVILAAGTEPYWERFR
jgi:hypothetical protein